jgi:DNA-binding NarL/FixJ family response regulator
MLRGLDNRQIAAELGLTYATVRSYARSLIKKLGARSRLQAVARAHRVGIANGR